MNLRLIAYIHMAPVVYSSGAMMIERIVSAVVWASFALAYSLMLRSIFDDAGMLYGAPDFVLWAVVPPLCAGTLGALLGPALAECYRDTFWATVLLTGALFPLVTYVLNAFLFAFCAAIASGEKILGTIIVAPLFTILFLVTAPQITVLLLLFGGAASITCGLTLRGLAKPGRPGGIPPAGG